MDRRSPDQLTRSHCKAEVERRVAATPDRVMLYDGDRATTFAQFCGLAERAAAGLMGLGVGPDVNVSWQLPTWTESAVLVGASK